MIRVYRLKVTYPEGSHDQNGVAVPGWEPPNWQPGPDVSPEEGPMPFGWPRRRLYLSKSGAIHRANFLREWGATVEIEESRPVEWEGS